MCMGTWLLPSSTRLPCWRHHWDFLELCTWIFGSPSRNYLGSTSLVLFLLYWYKLKKKLQLRNPKANPPNPHQFRSAGPTMESGTSSSWLLLLEQGQNFSLLQPPGEEEWVSYAAKVVCSASSAIVLLNIQSYTAVKGMFFLSDSHLLSQLLSFLLQSSYEVKVYQELWAKS